MRSGNDTAYPAPRSRAGLGLAIAVGLLWAAAIGATWYFYRENDSEGGLAAFFGRFHIIMVHMPIGLIFVVPLMEMVGWTRWGQAARNAVPFVLWMAVLTAAVATVLGFLMMNAEGFAGRWMTLHMWTGLGVGLASVLALIFKLSRVGSLYTLTLMAAVGLTAAAGHFGGAMVHSKEYLTEFAPEQIKPFLELGLASANATVAADDPGAGTDPVVGGDDAVSPGEDADSGEVPIARRQLFTEFVLPILEAKCTGCHSEEKIKGKLRLDTHEMIMAGAEDTDYPTVIPGDAETSEMIARVLMPEDDELFMPPDGKEKLTEQEIEVLKWWIAGGAAAEGSVAELQADEHMLAMLAAVSGSLAAGAEVVVDAEATTGVWPGLSAVERQARIDAAMAAAAEGGYSLLPISAEDDRFRVSAVNAAAGFGDEQLAELEPIAERIVWLDLGRTQVTDAGLAMIGNMPNLERLHLEKSQITDAGARHLAGLKQLEYLNLYGTDVSSAIFEPLAELRNLRKLFLWETKVDPNAALQFQREMSLEVNIGAEVASLSGEEGEEGAGAAVSVAEPEPEPATEPEAVTEPDTKPAVSEQAKPAAGVKAPEVAAEPKAKPVQKPEAKPKAQNPTKPQATDAKKADETLTPDAA